MSEYSCSICNHKSLIKQNLVRHINRKTKCGKGIPSIVEIPIEIKCEYCDKSFSCDFSMKRHLKTSCKNKDSEIIQGLKKELEETKFKLAVAVAKSEVPQTINQTINNTIIIKDVHFNPDIPENQNIYISNMRNGYVMVYNSDTKNWDARPKDEMINKLIDDREYDIQEWLGESDKYPKAMQKFNEYVEKKEEDGVQKMIKEEVELVLYNNRNMIKNKS